MVRLAATVALASAAVVLTAAQDVTFRSETRTVAIYATAQGRDGQLVTDLTRDEFQVRDNGAPVEIVQFSNDPQPITVVVMLEGELVRLIRIKSLAHALLAALGPRDLAMVGTFGGSEVAVRPRLVDRFDELHRIVDEELWPSEGTILWGAIERSFDVLDGEPGRRVSLVVSAGLNRCPVRTAGCRTFTEVRRAAVARSVLVYSAELQGTFWGRIDADPDPEMDRFEIPETLHALSVETGGGHALIADSDDIGEVAARIVEELRHQYVLGFVPERLDGREHQLEVTARPGVMIRARRSYLAR